MANPQATAATSLAPGAGGLFAPKVNPIITNQSGPAPVANPLTPGQPASVFGAPASKPANPSAGGLFMSQAAPAQ